MLCSLDHSNNTSTNQLLLHQPITGCRQTTQSAAAATATNQRV